jgi:hypothetical protein
VYFRELNQIRQIMAGIGEVVQGVDYGTIIMGLLPDSYRSIILSLEAAAGYASKIVTPQELITAVTVEYKHQLIRNPQTARKGRNGALTVGSNTHTRQHSTTKNITCYNCNKTSHFKLDCWAKGGGKEGQRLAGQVCRGPANATKPATNVAVVTPPPHCIDGKVL